MKKSIIICLICVVSAFVLYGCNNNTSTAGTATGKSSNKSRNVSGAYKNNNFEISLPDGTWRVKTERKNGFKTTNFLSENGKTTINVVYLNARQSKAEIKRMVTSQEQLEEQLSDSKMKISQFSYVEGESVRKLIYMLENESEDIPYAYEVIGQVLKSSKGFQIDVTTTEDDASFANTLQQCVDSFALLN